MVVWAAAERAVAKIMIQGENRGKRGASLRQRLGMDLVMAGMGLAARSFNMREVLAASYGFEKGWKF